MARSEEEIVKRLDELLRLPGGWLEGSGEVVSKPVVGFLRKYVKEIAACDHPVYIYPMEGGGVQLEWRDSRMFYGFEIFPDMSAAFYALDLQAKAATADEQIATVSGNFLKKALKR